MDVDVERAREGLAKIQREAADAIARAESAEARAKAAEAAIETTRAAVDKLSEAFEAEKLRAVESATGTVRELDYYVARADELAGAADAGAYARSANAPTIRMIGSRVRTADGGYVYHPGLLDDVQARSEEQIELQRAHVTARLAGAAMGGRIPAQAAADVRRAARRCGEHIERIFAANAGGGLEWAAIQYAPELERRQMAKVGLRSMLPQRIVAPGRSTSVPQLTGLVQFYDESVPSSNDPAGVPFSTIGTNERSIVTKSLACRVQSDRKMDDESAIDFASTVQQLMVEQWAFQCDDSIVNGDTASPHQDAIATWNPRSRLSSIVTSADHRARYLGLRAAAFDVGGTRTPDQSGTQTYAGISALVDLVGSENADGVIVVSWEVDRKMLLFSEFKTWDSVGAFASILTGRLGALAPNGVPLPNIVGMWEGTMPVVISDALTADLATTGLYTGSGAKSGVLVFDRSRFEFVQQSGTEVASVINPMNNTRSLVMRNYQADIARRFPSETAPVAFGRNWL